MVISRDTNLSSFFTFPICFKCQMTVEWSTLSSWATSCVVVRGSTLIIALSWSLSTSNGWPLCSSSWRLLSPLQNFLNHRCLVCSSAVPWPNALLMLWLFPLLNDPFSTPIRKSLQFAFCITSSPYSKRHIKNTAKDNSLAKKKNTARNLH